MKNATKILMAVAISLTALNGCKKKENNPTPTPTKPTGVMMAKVNGKTWQSDPSTNFKIVDGDTLRGITFQVQKDSLTMIASQLSDTSVIFGFITLKQPRVGSYSGASGGSTGLMLYVKPFNILNILAALQTTTTNYTFNITKFDEVNKKISGTYTLTMTPIIGGGQATTITEGEFTDVIYTVEP